MTKYEWAVEVEKLSCIEYKYLIIDYIKGLENLANRLNYATCWVDVKGNSTVLDSNHLINELLKYNNVTYEVDSAIDYNYIGVFEGLVCKHLYKMSLVEAPLTSI